MEVHNNNYFIITWRRLVTKLIEVDYWAYDDVIKDVVKWNGVFVIWWKTNSWKSTSIFGLLDYIHKSEPNKKYISIEDPVEKTFNFMEQLSVKKTDNEETTLDFKTYIKSLVRKDGNYTFIWEIRDKESLDWIVELSNIWYGILTTTHISNIFWLKTRVEKMWWNVSSLVENLKWLVVQQLVPTYDEIIPIKDIKTKYSNKDEITEKIESELYNYIETWQIWFNMKQYYKLCMVYQPLLNSNIVYTTLEEKNKKYFVNFEKLKNALESEKKFFDYIVNTFYIKWKNWKTNWMTLVYEVSIFNDTNKKYYLKDDRTEFIKNEDAYIPIFLHWLILITWKKTDFNEVYKLAKSF